MVWVLPPLSAKERPASACPPPTPFPSTHTALDFRLLDFSRNPGTAKHYTSYDKMRKDWLRHTRVKDEMQRTTKEPMTLAQEVRARLPYCTWLPHPAAAYTAAPWLYSRV